MTIAAFVALTVDHPAHAFLHGISRHDRLAFDLASPIFFLLNLARLVLHAVTTPRRRVALSLLAFGLVLWGSVSLLSVASTGVPQSTSFPTPGDTLFVAGVVSIAVFLVIDLGRTSAIPSAAWLDAMIACGGVVSVSSLVLSTAPSATCLLRCPSSPCSTWA